MRKLTFVIALLCLAALPWKAKRGVQGKAPAFASTKAVTFDGVDGWAKNEAISTTATHLSFWYRRHGTGATNASILYFQTSGGANTHTIVWLASGYIRFRYGAATTDPFADYTPPADETWVHVYVEQGATGYPLVYYDGSLQSPNATRAISGAVTTVGKVIVSSVSSLTWSLGSDFDLDELAIFASTQTPSVLYNGGAPGDLTALSPTYWWRMGDAAGDDNTVAADVIAGADLTLTGVQSAEVIDR